MRSRAVELGRVHVRGPLGDEGVTAEVDRALEAARALLAALPPELVYHDAEHTLGSVLPAAERYAAAEGLDDVTRSLVSIAAAFHDTGMLDAYGGHEEISARFAESAMRPLGFADEEVARVRGMILATRLPQTPRDPAERVLADADLDILGRPDFLDVNRRLRDELARKGTRVADVEWYLQQADFLRHHRYFTASARAHRDAGKRANLERLEAMARARGAR